MGENFHILKEQDACLYFVFPERSDKGFMYRKGFKQVLVYLQWQGKRGCKKHVKQSHLCMENDKRLNIPNNDKQNNYSCILKL